MSFRPLEIGIFVVLFCAFLAIPMLSRALGDSIDTLPARFAAVLLLLASLSYSRFVAVALFLVIAGLYIQHHQDDLMTVIGPQGDNNAASFPMPLKGMESPRAMAVLNQGGQAEVTYDEMDFVPKNADEDNYHGQAYNSIDTKHALMTEPLGSSRAQALFQDDMNSAERMANSNRNAAFSS